ncbi:hypothetical protein [Halobellus sp. EA9]|uniref:hypothetical protein n=1 Tax=Halobellus sp. EA9 TaxID=3421647 RepID=UPI003EC06506
MAPRLRVVLPEEGKVNFEEPISIEIAREPDSDRDEAALVNEVITEVGAQLKARVDPTVVDVNDLPGGEYKTKLIEERDG